MKHDFFIFFLILFLCQGFPENLKSQTILNKDTLYNLSKNVNDSISFHYIGCSGFFIRKGNNVVLIDPYFSYKKAYSFLFGKLTTTSNITTETRSLIDSVFLHSIGDSIDRSGLIKTLIITHAHVDHYGDIPYLFHSDRFNMDTIKIIGNTTAQYYLGGDKIPDKNIIKTVEASASSPSIEGKWIYISSKIRFVLQCVG